MKPASQITIVAIYHYNMTYSDKWFNAIQGSSSLVGKINAGESDVVFIVDFGLAISPSGRAWRKPKAHLLWLFPALKSKCKCHQAK